MEKENDYRPLADRMRPSSIKKYIGQEHILDKGKPLRKAIEQGSLHSMIFWGPPGTGKTTLAKLISKSCDAQFIILSAVLSGVKDIRTAIDKAKQYVTDGIRFSFDLGHGHGPLNHFYQFEQKPFI